MSQKIIFMPHANIQYSQLDPARRAWVCEHCYRPLFELVRDGEYRIAFEASGRTLEVMAGETPEVLALLKELGKKFDVCPAVLPERTKYKRPHLKVADLSAHKALEVARKYPDAVVIGADTLVFCKGEVIGKPKDEKDALRILRKLNGAWQTVYTGVTLVHVKSKNVCAGWIKLIVRRADFL